MITHLLSSRLHAMRVTVGLGVTPSLQITLLADFTAGREFHPAPENNCSICCHKSVSNPVVSSGSLLQRFACRLVAFAHCFS
jgi:hypothetical protein